MLYTRQHHSCNHSILAFCIYVSFLNPLCNCYFTSFSLVWRTTDGDAIQWVTYAPFVDDNGARPSNGFGAYSLYQIRWKIAILCLCSHHIYSICDCICVTKEINKHTHAQPNRQTKKIYINRWTKINGWMMNEIIFI